MNVMLLGIGDTLKKVFSIIPKLLYFIVSCVLSLIDLFQVGFRKLVGLDPIIIAGETYTGDPVYKLIIDALFGADNKYPAIRTVFWAFIIIGAFMLIATTIIAMLRLEYNPDKDKGNSKSGVIKSFFKAIFTFAIIPLTCFFGMYLCNALIGIIDKATAYSVASESEVATVYDKWSASDSDSDSAVGGSSTLTSRESSYISYEVFGLRIPTTSEPFSGMIFRACAYNSNRLRDDKTVNGKTYFEVLHDNETLFIIDKYQKPEDAANIIDTGFAINAKLKGVFDLNTEITEDYFGDSTDYINLGSWKYKGISSLSKYNVNAVYYFYDLWSFNYIVAFVAIITIGKLYYNFILYLMQRIFEVVGLFLVSPISTSLMPLDGGESIKSWRGMFMSKFGLLVVLVTALNLVTPLISICQNIQLFGIPVIDAIFNVFFIIAALNAVNSLNGMFSKLFTGDAGNYKGIADTASGITGSFSGGLSAAVGGAKIATAPFRLAGKGAALGVSKGVGAIRSHREKSIEEKLGKRETDAKNAYASGINELDDIDAKTEKDIQANQSDIDNLASDQSMFDDFTAQTGGFMERNDKNDRAMLEKYRRQNFAFGRNKEGYEEHKNKLANDSEYRQQILDKMYQADEDSKMNSYFKADNRLSDAENEANKESMRQLFASGQAGLDSRASTYETTRRSLIARKEQEAQNRDDTIADLKIRKANELNAIKAIRDERTAKSEARERRTQTTAKIVKSTQKATARGLADIDSVTNAIPGKELLGKTLTTLGFDKKKGDDK